MGETNNDYVPVTIQRCQHIAGPFYHGTKAAREVGDELVPGYGSNFHQGRTSNNIYSPRSWTQPSGERSLRPR